MASAEHQLQQLQQKQLQLIKLQQQKQKLEQKLAETSKGGMTVTGGAGVGVSALATGSSHYTPYASELFPPTPKNTPFFMTPTVTPPNEIYHMHMGGGSWGLPMTNPGILEAEAEKMQNGLKAELGAKVCFKPF